MRINTLESFVNSLSAMNSEIFHAKANSKYDEMSLTLSSIANAATTVCSNQRSFSMFEGCETRADAVFGSALAEWDAKREKLLEELKAEQGKLEDQLAKCDRMRVRLQNKDEDLIQMKEKELLTREMECSIQFKQEQERLSKEEVQAQTSMPHMSKCLRQELFQGVHLKIIHLSKLEMVNTAHLNDKKEDLRNKPWNVLSFFVGPDSETRALTKAINFEKQKDRFSSELKKVQARQRTSESGLAWKQMMQFDADEFKILSNEFCCCLIKGAQLNESVKLHKHEMKQVRKLEQIAKDLEWLTNEVCTGKCWSASKMPHAREFSTHNDFFKTFDFKRR